ncbi:putative peptidoglycan binding protein [Paraburkholderia sp. BL23I1N1]|uniref:glycoside hydrolase family 108 protein n=1 Tax=Paraburkholderia sp. BL23I1N1 TaxID=1938802 RepID=UPI000E727BC4|nr:glycosyl hydrolase 108 family protein [Paraburkholderia sp. BL23I1N1]RKE36631.1 putative peptidoglycan binding protein [Paraburkholderia sp. BL23I1N1]
MSGFDDTFAYVIGIERGYVVDDGGPTMWGITQAVARECGFQGDMHDLTLDQAKQIAKTKYWDVFHCDDFDPRIGQQVFDAAYNGGHPVLWLQQCTGATPDGQFGPATLAAVKAANVDRLIAKFDAYRLLYMCGLDVWPSYSKGWARRIANNILAGESP